MKDTVIIEVNGKRYVAEDDTHTLEVYEDETGAELELYKAGVGSLCIQLKEIKSN